MALRGRLFAGQANGGDRASGGFAGVLATLRLKGASERQTGRFGALGTDRDGVEGKPAGGARRRDRRNRPVGRSPMAPASAKTTCLDAEGQKRCEGPAGAIREFGLGNKK